MFDLTLRSLAGAAATERFDQRMTEGKNSMPQRKRVFASEIMTMVVMFAALGGVVLAAQDKYTVQVPNGLAFSDFRGFEDWQSVAVSQAGDLIEVILANPGMIDAYKAGVPGNGKPFPDGSKIAKIHWKAKKSAEAPDPTTVPDTLHDVDLIERDSKRFPDSGGWGYAQFNYNVASDTFTPEGNGTNCGYACHTIVKAKDYIFTAYGKR
jgi:hypothetical protein